MYNMQPDVEYGISKLIEFRSRYNQQEYPRKVASNVVYLLMVIEKLVLEMDYAFQKSAILKRPKQIFSDIQIAQNEIARKVQGIISDLVPIVDTTLDKRNKILNVDMNKLRNDYISASNGDIARMENLEFSYIFYYCIQILIIHWLAYGLYGETKESGFKKLFNAPILKPIDQSNTILLFEEVSRVVIPLYYKPLRSYVETMP